MASLLILLLVLVLVAFPIWAIFKLLSLESKNAQLERRLSDLEHDLASAREPLRVPARPETPSVIATPFPPPALSTIPREPAPADVPPAISPPTLAPPPPAPAAGIPTPPLPPPPPPLVTAAFPTTAPSLRPEIPTSVARAPSKPRFNWEQFTGTKLLAWTGGAAAFLGAAFFIKYSFEHELIPPAVRVVIGYVFAFALVIVGLKMPRVRYAVTAQTLCATGIVCLYAVTFACNSIYDFPFFTPLRTFPLMALITAGAFFLAVQLRAQVVAILGLLGGFLTPVLLSTGRDNTLGLFSYIALLDIGLIALALHQRWLFLVPLGAAGTVAMQIGWSLRFLNQNNVTTAMNIALTFCALFLAANETGRRLDRSSAALRGSALAFPLVAFGFATLFLLAYPSIAARPVVLFGFVFAADACLLALAWFDRRSPHVHLIGGFAVFALLALWTGMRLTPTLLSWALALYLIHGVIHTTFPLLLARRRPGETTSWWSQLFPSLALVLLLLPLLKLDSVSFALWPSVLLIDLLAIALAVLSGSVLAAALAFVLTLAATAIWMFRVPTTDAPEALLLIVIGGFAALFFAAGVVFARRSNSASAAPGDSLRDARVQLPAFSALMPFVLLTLMTQRLALPGPSGVFGLALVLTLLCLGLTSALRVAWLPACALVGVALLEFSWEARHATRSLTAPAFLWYLIFYGVFVAFPFVFRSRFAAVTGPWAVAALVGIAQFPLVYRAVERAWPNDVMGVVPALFAIAPLAGLAVIRRLPAADDYARLNQLAWFGGVALLFLTLIIPIQFERQWITLGWALEGAALLWLFRRVPHPGLRATGVALLVAAFARLALNPAVLDYHARSAMPIFNWYLYTYGLTSLCLFTGATLATRPDDRAFGLRIGALLNALGTVLTFLLLNIEIADFFSPPGTRVLTFQFSGNFARDMTYTIAWALFALALLLISIWKRTRAGRYAALALLGVAVLKLFLHDLERLGALHRIGALFAVAIIAIAASLLYQRFLPGEDSAGSKR